MPYKKTMRVVFVFFMSALALVAAKAASPGLPRSELRLMDGGSFGSARLAGVEIGMEPHVKTYWRTPGDAGLPPVFQWDGSDNLDHVEVLWPLPALIPDPAGMIFGYEDHIIFPLAVTPKDPAKPVHLALTLDYAVCGTLCVPMQGKVTIDLSPSGGDTPDRLKIMEFLNHVPRKASLHDGLKPGLVTMIADPAHPDDLIVTTNAPIAELLVEGPNDYAFGDAKMLSPTKWQISLVAKPSGAILSQLPLTVTLSGPDGASETGVTLDGAGAIR
jgi:DsbC/DsbD-like thiol-disulfide interchange protein